MLARRKALRRRRARQPNTGFIKIVRKCPDILLQNTAVAGVFNITDPTGNCIASSGSGTATGFLGTWDIPFSMKFSLSQVLQSNDLTQIADKYKLKKTVVDFYFNSNSNSVLAPSSLPQLAYIVDTDDASIPTLAQIKEKMGSKVRYFNNKNMLRVTLYPRPTAEVYNTGVTTTYSPGFNGWIDCNTPSTEHYGLKACFQNVNLPASASQVGFKMMVEHHLILKDLQ